MIIILLGLIICIMLFGANEVLSFLIGLVGFGLFLGFCGLVLGLIYALFSSL